MSILSTLALVFAPLALRPKAREIDEQALIDLKEAQDELAAARDQMAGMRRELETLRITANQAPMPQFNRMQALGAQQADPGLQALMYAQMANTRPLHPADIMNENPGYYYFCNCVPARHDFLGRRP